MPSTAKPVLFIHGLWLHGASWPPWIEVFADAGYNPIAPGWPGEPDTVEETREDPEAIAGQGIDDVVDHYAEIIRGSREPADPGRALLRRDRSPRSSWASTSARPR